MYFYYAYIYKYLFLSSILPKYQDEIENICSKAKSDSNQLGSPTQCQCSSTEEQRPFSELLPETPNAESLYGLWECRPEECTCGNEQVPIDGRFLIPIPNDIPLPPRERIIEILNKILNRN